MDYGARLHTPMEQPFLVFLCSLSLSARGLSSAFSSISQMKNFHSCRQSESASSSPCQHLSSDRSDPVARLARLAPRFLLRKVPLPYRAGYMVTQAVSV